MKVKFNRITKELTFLDGTTTLNSSDVLWHTLEVEMEGGDLLPNEHLFVAFSKVDGSISTQGDLLPKQGAYHIPQEVLASAGDWTLQILIRVYDAVSGSYIQRGASNKGSFSVEEGLHFNGEDKPVTINSLGGVKTDLSIAQEDISKLSEEVETIPLIVNTSVQFGYSFLQVLRGINGETDGDFSIGDIILPFEVFNRKPLPDDEFWLDIETDDGYKVKILARVDGYYYEEADQQIVWFFAGEIDFYEYESTNGEGVWNDKLIIIRNGITQSDIEANISENKDDIDALKESAIKSIQVSVSETDYKLTVGLIKENGEKVSSNTIDLPLESMVVDAEYNPAAGGAIVLTLQSGSIIAIPVADIVRGLIPSAEKGIANGVASLDANGKVPQSQLPDDIGSGGGVSEERVEELIDEKIGDIETALDSIIAIQTSLIGG